MVEQQLVDYIKKARSAGQTDDQTKNLLYKNGWIEQEVRDAFLAVNQPSQPQPAAQAQQKPQEPRLQPQPQVQSQQPQYQSSQSSMPAKRKSHVLLNIFISLILIAIIVVGVFFVISKVSLVKEPESAGNTASNSQTQQEQGQVQQQALASKNIIVVPDDYDATKISVAAISKSGDKAVYCAPQKISGAVSCFQNSEKLTNPYNYKPYWIGFSPNEERVVFLYYDPVKLQSFVFEDGQELTRHNGTITSPNFSQDSKSFMYMVIGRDNKSFVVIDEKPRNSYDKIYGIPTLSSDGKFLIYGARSGQVILYVADKVQD